MYSGGCGYRPKFDDLADQISENVPTANVNGKEGRTGNKLNILTKSLYCL